VPPDFSFYRNAHFEIKFYNGEDMGIKEIEIEIRKLDLKDRATLAKWLIDSLDELPDAEIEALWVEEAERRLDEFEKEDCNSDIR